MHPFPWQAYLYWHEYVFAIRKTFPSKIDQKGGKRSEQIQQGSAENHFPIPEYHNPPRLSFSSFWKDNTPLIVLGHKIADNQFHIDIVGKGVYISPLFFIWIRDKKLKGVNPSARHIRMA